MSDCLSVLGLIVSILTLIVALIAIYFAWRIPNQILANQVFAELISKYTEIGPDVRYVFEFFYKKCNCNLDEVNEKYKEQYEKDFPYICDNNKCNNEVNEKYKEQYKKDFPIVCDKNICNNKDCKQRLFYCFDCQNDKKPEETLHFRRRRIDHYFWLVSELFFGSLFPVKLSDKILRRWFTAGERKLLAIIYNMNEAEDEIKNGKPNLPDDTKLDDCDTTLDDYTPKGEKLMWANRKRLYKESKNWK